MAKVRIARVEDVEEAREFHEQTFQRGTWKGDEHEHWFAWEGDRVVGFASACFNPGTNTVFLSSAAVVRSYRQRGLQRRLIQVRVAWARRMGASAVTTYVSLRNYKSLVNLIRCGFRCYQKPHADDWHVLYRRLRRVTQQTLNTAIKDM